MLAGGDRRHPARRPGHRLLPARVPRDEHRRLRRDPGGRERDRKAIELSGFARARRPPSLAGLAADDRDALAGGDPWHRRLHRQVPADPRARQRRLHVVRDRARDRVDDLARVLPARDRDDVDGLEPRAPPTRRVGGRQPRADRRRLATRPTRSTPRARRRARERVGRAVSHAVPYPEVVLVAVVFAFATVFFGIFPSPLFRLAAHAGHALTGIF